MEEDCVTDIAQEGSTDPVNVENPFSKELNS